MADLLFVRPADDQAAILCSLIGDRLVRWLQSGAHSITKRTFLDLPGSTNTSRAQVDAELAKGHGHLLYFGHGRPNALVGNGVALVDNTNVGWLPRSSVVVAVACYSRSGLGTGAVGRGEVTAYLGWEDELPIPQLYPLPMVDALSFGLLPLLQGQDVTAAITDIKARLATALASYQSWQPPASAGAGAALWAKMAPVFAAACLDVEGTRTATL